jgi:glycosyltransferase involved in cell wall biosynthesis
MRIAIDLVVAEKNPGGMLFASRALLEGLARIDQHNEYIIITSRPREYQHLQAAPGMRVYPVTLPSRRAVTIQHQLLMPRVLRKLQPDVLHVPAFVSPVVWNGPLVMTVHDLAFLTMPDQLPLHARIYWQYLLQRSVRHAQRIIAVSEQTRAELTSYWGIKASRIRLVHNALRPSLRYWDIAVDDILRIRRRYGDRYLLHVGRIVPRKNIDKLVQAFDLLASRFTDLHLVLAGGAGHGSASVIQRVCDTAN